MVEISHRNGGADTKSAIFRTTPLRAAFVLLIFGTFTWSCVLPAYYGEGGFMEGGTEVSGLLVLLAGTSEFFGPWFANPCLLVGAGFILGKRDWTAFFVGGIGCLLALYPALEYSMFFSASFHIQPVVELGRGTDRHQALRIGYFVWVATHFLHWCGTLFFAMGSLRYGLTL